MIPVYDEAIGGKSNLETHNVILKFTLRLTRPGSHELLLELIENPLQLCLEIVIQFLFLGDLLSQGRMIVIQETE